MSMKFLIILLCAFFLSACGQTGRLYLPYCPPSQTVATIPPQADNIPVDNFHQVTQHSNDLIPG